MKNSLVIIAIFIIGIFQLSPKPRTEIQAREVAQSFLSKKLPAFTRSFSSLDLNLAYVKQSFSFRSNINNQPYYYVFNINENRGFIIISGNDNAKAVLGYSNNGVFDSDNLPDGFQYWLGFYQEEMEYLYTLEENECFIVNNEAYYDSNNFPKVVEPLVRAKWNQDFPYNMYCPIVPDDTGKQAVSGCVATATAQVMHYYRWPEKGDSSKVYTTRTHKMELSIDYFDTYYDWENMTNTYDINSTQEENEAVATLMYHVGTAANMNYGHTSGAYSRDMAQALVTYFNYDKNIRYIQRAYYSFSEWKSIIKQELAENRPVLYAGSSSSGAHLFVCDGYDENDFFHINWGWGGTSDGYFELTALAPGTQGIGGTTEGYNRSQEIIIGIQQPTEQLQKSFYEITMKTAPEISADRINRTDTFRLTAVSIYNRGSNLFSGKFAIGLYADNELKNILIEKEVDSLKANYGWETYNIDTSIEEEVANGYYKLYVIYKGNDQSEWNIVRAVGGVNGYVNVIVTNRQVYFSEAVDARPSLIVNECETVGGYYANKAARLKMNIANNGAEYNSYLFFCLESESNGEMNFLSPYEVFFLPEGEIKEMIFELKLNNIKAGNYRLYVLEDYHNNFSSDHRRFLLKEPLEIEIREEPDFFNLKLSSQIFAPNPQYMKADNLQITATIKNNGGLFADYMTVYLFKEGESSSSDRFGYRRVFIDKDEELTIDFNGSLEIENGNYTAMLIYWNEDAGDWGYFTPSIYASTNIRITDEDPPLLDLNSYNFVDICIYPNPVNNVLNIHSAININAVSIYDILGKKCIERFYSSDNNIVELPLDKLEKGNYIIKVNTLSGEIFSKFIKI